MIPIEERTWKNAPSIVRDVRLLTVLVICLYVGYMISGIVNIRHGGPVNPVIYGLHTAFEIWMLKAMRLGIRPGYYIQNVLSVLLLFNMPIGTIIGIFILVKWNKPENRAWFGI